MTVIDYGTGSLTINIQRNDGSEETIEVLVLPWVYRQQLCLDKGDEGVHYIPLSNIKSWKVVQ